MIILGACSGPSAGPDAIVQDLAKSLDEGHPEALWDALPASYQTDINEVIGLFAANMDKDVYNKGFQVADKLVSVLKNKKQFILGHPMIAGMSQGRLNDETYDAVISTLETYTTSEISTLDGMKNLNVRSFLTKTGGNAAKDIKTLSELSNSEAVPFEKLQDIEVNLVSHSGEKATISVKAGDETEEVELVMVEGKWVPAKMASGWKDGVAEAKTKMTELSSQMSGEQKTQALMSMDMALAALGQFEAASTQEEFNTALGGIMGMAMGGMGGGAQPPMGE